MPGGGEGEPRVPPPFYWSLPCVRVDVIPLSAQHVYKLSCLVESLCSHWGINSGASPVRTWLPFQSSL